MLLWSTVATGFKLGLAHLAVAQLLFIGTSISWVFFGIVAFVRGSYRVRPDETYLVLSLGIINPFLYYLVLFGSYARLPAQIAQPLNLTWAIVLALLAVPILKQRLTRRAVAGIMVSYLGVVVVLSQNPASADTPLSSVGIALALSSTVLWASYWLFGTRCRSEPLAIMFHSFTVGLVLVAAACGSGPGWPTLNMTNLFYGAWVGLIEMGVTYLLWQRALKLTSNAGRIGQLIFLTPFLSLVMIATVLGETVRATSIVGLVIIVCGLLTTGTPKQEAAST